MTVTGKGKSKAPISSHPLFPAVVALWFAALLGLGCMVLPAILLERLIGATGLGALLPAAQPPLGATARIAVALGGAVLGAVVGLFVARKVVAAQAAPAPSRRRAAPERAEREEAKRPFSARDELELDGLEVPSEIEKAPRATPIAGRRRPLSVTDENRRSDFLESAPLPGADPYAAPAPASEPLDLAGFAEPDPGLAEHEEEAPAKQVFGSASLSAPSNSPPAVATIEASEPEAVATPPETPAPTVEPQRFSPAPEGIRMTYSGSVDRFGAPAPAEARDEFDAVFAASPRAELAERPLVELGTVELVERFALALQRRATSEDTALELPAFKTPAAREADRPAIEPDPVAATEPEPPVAQFETIPPAPAIPAALRPIGFEEADDEPHDEEAPVAGLTLPLEPQDRPFARPAIAAPEPVSELPAPLREIELGEDDDSGEESDGAGYSSLLAMKSPFGAHREFVRIEDNDDEADREVEPVVVFPGQQPNRRATPASDGPSRDPLTQPGAPQAGFRPFDAPPQNDSKVSATSPLPAAKADSGAAEHALRAALEKLERMSGAG